MKNDLYIKPNSKLATYSEEKLEYSLSNKKLDKQYLRIENTVEEVENYQELVKRFEIKTLDSSTGLKELKLDKIRAIHFLYHDETFVYLGTFIKQTKKTPVTEINKNNKRIDDYIKQKDKAGY